MIEFITEIKKYENKGEKTGWTYIDITDKNAEKLKPGNKKTFRVRGAIDDYIFEGMALIPAGEGHFIMALNASIRKIIRKQRGEKIKVMLEEDVKPIKLNSDLIECLAEEPESLSFFNELSPGHRKYFSNWINSAKTDATKTKRIAQTIIALSHRQHYGQMIRALTTNKKDKLL